VLALLTTAALARAEGPAAPEREASAPASRPADLLKQAAVIQRSTARLRELRVRRAIPMGVQTRQQIQESVERRLERDYTDEEVQAEAAVLRRLGLIPVKLDYRAEVLGLLREQVAGYYDPRQRRLHLADWLPMSLQGPTLAHEICHALQDQHFDLKRLMKPLKENSDQQLAQVSLIEGDCTAVMFEFALAPLGGDLGQLENVTGPMIKAAISSGGGARFKAAPRFLQETLLFPYLQGLRLIQKVRAVHPWSVVNGMYKRPPESSEQILHPEKYWKRERPVVIKPGTLPALAGYERVKTDVLGELQLSLYLGQGVEESVATRAAAGWGGDLLLAYRKDAGAPVVLVHLTAWDTEADAQEFANAQRHVLVAQKLKAKPGAGEDGPWSYGDGKGAEWSVQRAGEAVLVLHGAPPALRAALQTEVWERFRVGGKRVKP